MAPNMHFCEIETLICRNYYLPCREVYQGSHFLENPGMSWNRAKCPGKSWNLKWLLFHFFEIWNRPIPSFWNFLYIFMYNVLEITQKYPGKSWKLLKNVLEITQKCPGNYSKMSWKLLQNVLEITPKCPGNYSEISWKVLQMIQEIWVGTQI